MRKVKSKIFLLSLAAILLLGGNINVALSYFSASSCEEVSDDDPMSMPNSAFQSEDMRFWFSPMSPEKSCRNKESKVFVVSAAKNFVVKSDRIYWGADKSIKQVHVKKGDLLMMFEDRDMKGTGKVKIIFGENYVMISVREGLLVEDKNGKILKSEAIDPCFKVTSLGVMNQYVNDKNEWIEVRNIYEKPDLKSKVVAKFRRHTVLPMKDIMVKNEDNIETLFMAVQLPGGGIGYLLPEGINFPVYMI